MFDDLKEKIDDFISSIRSKLPGSKSDDDDDEEYEDEEGEFDEKTEEIDVKEKLQDSDDEEDDDEFDDEEEDEDEDDAKAKKQKFMRLGLVGVVLILGASILLEDGEDENVVPEVKPIVRKNRPKRKKKAVAPKAVEKKVEKESVPAEPKVADKPVTDPTPTPPIDESQETVVVENELKLVDDTPEAGPDTVDPLGKEGFENAPNIQTTDSSASLGEDNSVENSQTNINDNDEMSEVIDNLTNDEPPAMIEKVVNEKLEYQEPPSYQDTGRGLVYNCSGKHWACVDQTSYLNCKKNNDWSKENDKDPECYPSNVYRSFKDCRTIQIHNINTVTETDFCKK